MRLRGNEREEMTEDPFTFEMDMATQFDFGLSDQGDEDDCDDDACESADEFHDLPDPFGDWGENINGCDPETYGSLVSIEQLAQLPPELLARMCVTWPNVWSPTARRLAELVALVHEPSLNEIFAMLLASMLDLPLSPYELARFLKLIEFDRLSSTQLSDEELLDYVPLLQGFLMKSRDELLELMRILRCRPWAENPNVHPDPVRRPLKAVQVVSGGSGASSRLPSFHDPPAAIGATFKTCRVDSDASSVVLCLRFRSRSISLRPSCANLRKSPMCQPISPLKQGCFYGCCGVSIQSLRKRAAATSAKRCGSRPFLSLFIHIITDTTARSRRFHLGESPATRSGGPQAGRMRLPASRRSARRSGQI